MARNACHVCLVSPISGRRKNMLWKASARSGHKTKQAGQQGRRAEQAARLAGQSGLLNLFEACLLWFVPDTSTLVLLKWLFHKLMCIQLSTFLRYLWVSLIHGANVMKLFCPWITNFRFKLVFVPSHLFKPCLTNTNFVRKLVNYGHKSYILLGPCDNVLQLFTPVIC